MKTKITPAMNILGSNSPLSNAFIRIKNERTPYENFFFRLDQLKCVSVIGNSGLTPLLEVGEGTIDPTVTYEQFITFISYVIDEVQKNGNQVRIFELLITEETVRGRNPRTHKTINAT